jgi:competence protein ComEC
VHGRPYERGAFGWSALKTAARVQIAFTLALLPVMVLLFHQVSLVSPPANAVAIPIVSWVVTPLALLGAACAALPWPLTALAEPLLASANGLFGALAAALQWISAPAWAALALPAPPWPVLVTATLGIAWCLAPPGWPLRWAGLIALLPLLAWPGERPEHGALWITALDVGQGSAVVLETRDQAWLYDAGPRYSQEADAGERIVLPYLRSRGLSTLDGLIVSHLDQDHSGGVASVLCGVGVRRLISSVAAGHPASAVPPENLAAPDWSGSTARCSGGRFIQWTAITSAACRPTR